MKTELTIFLEKIAQIKLARMGYWVVYPEIYGDYNCGVLDVAGARSHWTGKRVIETIGVEIKISRADYFGRKQKVLAARSERFAKEEELGANYRYFFTPKGLIKKEELYEGWGLMEWDAERKRVLTTVKAPRKEVNNEMILYSMARLPLYLYHQQKTKLMYGYDWVSYPEFVSQVSLPTIQRGRQGVTR